MDVPTKHQKKIALDTLKMNAVMANVMGGMNLKDAYFFMHNNQKWSHEKIQAYMRQHGHSNSEITELLEA